jgi:hypothetical protein
MKYRMEWSEALLFRVRPALDLPHEFSEREAEKAMVLTPMHISLVQVSSWA